MLHKYKGVGDELRWELDKIQQQIQQKNGAPNQPESDPAVFTRQSIQHSASPRTNAEIRGSKVLTMSELQNAKTVIESKLTQVDTLLEQLEYGYRKRYGEINSQRQLADHSKIAEISKTRPRLVRLHRQIQKLWENEQHMVNFSSNRDTNWDNGWDSDYSGDDDEGRDRKAARSGKNIDDDQDFNDNSSSYRRDHKNKHYVYPALSMALFLPPKTITTSSKPFSFDTDSSAKGPQLYNFFENTNSFEQFTQNNLDTEGLRFKLPFPLDRVMTSLYTQFFVSTLLEVNHRKTPIAGQKIDYFQKLLHNLDQIDQTTSLSPPVLTKFGLFQYPLSFKDTVNSPEYVLNHGMLQGSEQLSLLLQSRDDQGSQTNPGNGFSGDSANISSRRKGMMARAFKNTKIFQNLSRTTKLQQIDPIIREKIAKRGNRALRMVLNRHTATGSLIRVHLKRIMSRLREEGGSSTLSFTKGEHGSNGQTGTFSTHRSDQPLIIDVTATSTTILDHNDNSPVHKSKSTNTDDNSHLKNSNTKNKKTTTPNTDSSKEPTQYQKQRELYDTGLKERRLAELRSLSLEIDSNLTQTTNHWQNLKKDLNFEISTFFSSLRTDFLSSLAKYAYSSLIITPDFTQGADNDAVSSQSQIQSIKNKALLSTPSLPIPITQSNPRSNPPTVLMDVFGNLFNSQTVNLRQIEPNLGNLGHFGPQMYTNQPLSWLGTAPIIGKPSTRRTAAYPLMTPLEMDWERLFVDQNNEQDLRQKLTKFFDNIDNPYEISTDLMMSTLYRLMSESDGLFTDKTNPINPEHNSASLSRQAITVPHVPLLPSPQNWSPLQMAVWFKFIQTGDKQAEKGRKMYDIFNSFSHEKQYQLSQTGSYHTHTGFLHTDQRRYATNDEFSSHQGENGVDTTTTMTRPQPLTISPLASPYSRHPHYQHVIDQLASTSPIPWDIFTKNLSEAQQSGKNPILSPILGHFSPKVDQMIESYRAMQDIANPLIKNSEPSKRYENSAIVQDMIKAEKFYSRQTQDQDSNWGHSVYGNYHITSNDQQSPLLGGNTTKRNPLTFGQHGRNFLVFYEATVANHFKNVAQFPSKLMSLFDPHRYTQLVDVPNTTPTKVDRDEGNTRKNKDHKNTKPKNKVSFDDIFNINPLTDESYGHIENIEVESTLTLGHSVASPPTQDQSVASNLDPTEINLAQSYLSSTMIDPTSMPDNASHQQQLYGSRLYQDHPFASSPSNYNALSPSTASNKRKFVSREVLGAWVSLVILQKAMALGLKGRRVEELYALIAITLGRTKNPKLVKHFLALITEDDEEQQLQKQREWDRIREDYQNGIKVERLSRSEQEATRQERRIRRNAILPQRYQDTALLLSLSGGNRHGKAQEEAEILSTILQAKRRAKQNQNESNLTENNFTRNPNESAFSYDQVDFGTDQYLSQSKSTGGYDPTANRGQQINSFDAIIDQNPVNSSHFNNRAQPTVFTQQNDQNGYGGGYNQPQNTYNNQNTVDAQIVDQTQTKQTPTPPIQSKQQPKQQNALTHYDNYYAQRSHYNMIQSTQISNITQNFQIFRKLTSLPSIVQFVYLLSDSVTSGVFNKTVYLTGNLLGANIQALHKELWRYLDNDLLRNSLPTQHILTSLPSINRHLSRPAIPLQLLLNNDLGADQGSSMRIIVTKVQIQMRATLLRLLPYFSDTTASLPLLWTLKSNHYRNSHIDQDCVDDFLELQVLKRERLLNTAKRQKEHFKHKHKPSQPNAADEHPPAISTQNQFNGRPPREQFRRTPHPQLGSAFQETIPKEIIDLLSNPYFASGLSMTKPPIGISKYHNIPLKPHLPQPVPSPIVQTPFPPINLDNHDSDDEIPFSTTLRPVQQQQITPTSTTPSHFSKKQTPSATIDNIDTIFFRNVDLLYQSHYPLIPLTTNLFASSTQFLSSKEIAHNLQNEQRGIKSSQTHQTSVAGYVFSDSGDINHEPTSNNGASTPNWFLPSDAVVISMLGSCSKHYQSQRAWYFAEMQRGYWLKTQLPAPPMVNLVNLKKQQMQDLGLEDSTIDNVLQQVEMDTSIADRIEDNMSPEQTAENGEHETADEISNPEPPQSQPAPLPSDAEHPSQQHFITNSWIFKQQMTMNLKVHKKTKAQPQNLEPPLAPTSPMHKYNLPFPDIYESLQTTQDVIAATRGYVEEVALSLATGTNSNGNSFNLPHSAFALVSSLLKSTKLTNIKHMGDVDPENILQEVSSHSVIDHVTVELMKMTPSERDFCLDLRQDEVRSTLYLSISQFLTNPTTTPFIIDNDNANDESSSASLTRFFNSHVFECNKHIPLPLLESFPLTQTRLNQCLLEFTKHYMNGVIYTPQFDLHLGLKGSAHDSGNVNPKNNTKDKSAPVKLQPFRDNHESDEIPIVPSNNNNKNSNRELVITSSSFDMVQLNDVLSSIADQNLDSTLPHILRPSRKLPHAPPHSHRTDLLFHWLQLSMGQLDPQMVMETIKIFVEAGNELDRANQEFFNENHPKFSQLLRKSSFISSYCHENRIPLHSIDENTMYITLRRDENQYKRVTKSTFVSLCKFFAAAGLVEHSLTMFGAIKHRLPFKLRELITGLERQYQWDGVYDAAIEMNSGNENLSPSQNRQNLENFNETQKLLNSLQFTAEIWDTPAALALISSLFFSIIGHLTQLPRRAAILNAAPKLLIGSSSVDDNFTSDTMNNTNQLQTISNHATQNHFSNTVMRHRKQLLQDSSSQLQLISRQRMTNLTNMAITLCQYVNSSRKTSTTSFSQIFHSLSQSGQIGMTLSLSHSIMPRQFSPAVEFASMLGIDTVTRTILDFPRLFLQKHLELRLSLYQKTLNLLQSDLCNPFNPMQNIAEAEGLTVLYEFDHGNLTKDHIESQNDKNKPNRSRRSTEVNYNEGIAAFMAQITPDQHRKLIQTTQEQINHLEKQLNSIISDSDANNLYLDQVQMLTYESILHRSTGISHSDPFVDQSDDDKAPPRNPTSFAHYNQAIHTKLNPSSIESSQSDITTLPSLYRALIPSLANLDHPTVLYSLPAMILHYNKVQAHIQLASSNPTLRALIEHEYLIPRAVLDSLEKYFNDPDVFHGNNKNIKRTTLENQTDLDDDNQKRVKSAPNSIPAFISSVPVPEGDVLGLEKLCIFVLNSFDFNDQSFNMDHSNSTGDGNFDEDGDMMSLAQNELNNTSNPASGAAGDQLESNSIINDDGSTTTYVSEDYGIGSQSNPKNKKNDSSANNNSGEQLTTITERALNRLGIYTSFTDAISSDVSASASINNSTSVPLSSPDANPSNALLTAKLLDSLKLIIDFQHGIADTQEGLFPWHPTPSVRSIPPFPISTSTKSQSLLKFMSMGDIDDVANKKGQSKSSKIQIDPDQAVERLTRYVFISQVLEPVDYKIPMNTNE